MKSAKKKYILFGLYIVLIFLLIASMCNGIHGLIHDRISNVSVWSLLRDIVAIGIALYMYRKLKLKKC